MRRTTPHRMIENLGFDAAVMSMSYHILNLEYVMKLFMITIVALMPIHFLFCSVCTR
jgi:hypothetical protein